MNLRLVEVYLPQEKGKLFEELMAEYSHKGIWQKKLENNQLEFKIVLSSGEVEPLIDCLVDQFKDVEDFRLLLLPVEASLPRLESSENSVGLPDSPNRINREEIYTNVASSIHFSWTQISLLLLSSSIAAIGLVRGSEAVIIGAMVIAPLLKPNMALAVATILGDFTLAVRTMRVGAIGVLIPITFSILIGLLYPISPELPEIAVRTKLTLADIVVALASGAAAAISLTAGEISSVVGVMVSVALLPPLVTWGMLMGSGEWQPALGAMLLLIANIASLNLAAIATLLLQDLRPAGWWQNIKARKLTKIASGAWIVLLVGLIGVIFVLKYKGV
ncbi:TIGR00341 family protein [Rivularia sp. UHCC 0363]|uniref:TIGR00341 family protein n=1 Tax=Rivularia sp. UHCC 0363 TaxID=3110244 RepID=UPI002B1EC3F5|nr:TIGR00341 family protein [Rivularia sp. UHCC 0363]MEA5598693.1 TIGR00341 family protein [Rivularia sp. UHCC 0363]